MRLQDNIDFTTLQWVKPELDETFGLARQALEAYVDNPGDREVMRSCADNLHQVQGTLRMVELYGAAMVAEEMETLTISLLEDHVAHREEAYAALMRGLMQLPDYLERLSSGHRDVPVVLLPLLNELRASRAKEALNESALFTPNLGAALPPQAPVAASAEDAARRHGEVAELRLRFQQQLLAWFRGQGAQQQLTGMRNTLNAIAARCVTIPGRRLWWIAAGVLEGLDQGMLKNHAAEVRQLIGKVDRSIRQLIENGEDSLAGGDADELAHKLLYIVAQAKQRSPQMALVAQTYGLDGMLPDAGELEHARGSMTGHNRALLDSVSRALKDDLLRVKDALDLYLRQQSDDPSRLAEQTEVLDRVGDTLGMLALAVPRRVVTEQRRVLADIANRTRVADEETLLDVAGALLYVEASLDDHIESLGAENDRPTPTEEAPTTMLPRSEARHILATLMGEAIANTAKVKDAIVAFVESGWQHAQLANASALMEEVAGAMRMLSSSRSASIAEGIGRFIGNELEIDQRVPTSVQMDHLADALAALEYYLEAAREHRGGLEHILDVAEHSLGELGYWPPLPAREAVALPQPPVVAEPHDDEPNLSETVSLADGVDASALFIGEHDAPAPEVHDVSGLHLAETEPLAPSSSATDGGDDWIEIEEEVVEQVHVADPLAANAGFQIGADGIDDEIREIFLEEMQEEITNLQTAEAAWLEDPSQQSQLTAIRRSFHTLKGSGRLVGASTLGEFAWKVEDMLNRVLDGTIQPHEGVQALVHHAIAALPAIRAALEGDGVADAPISAIMSTAEQLAKGQDQARVADHLGATQTVRRMVKRRVPRVEADADAIPTASLSDIERAADAAATEASLSHAEGATFAEPVLPPIDPVLLEILRSEVAQHLQTIRTTVGRSSGELMVDDGLLRAVHTMHGAIAMVDIPLLMHLLSPLETLLKRLRGAGHALSIEGVGLLGQSADVVDEVMAQFDAAQPRLPDADALIARIVELRDQEPEVQVAHVVFEPQAHEIDSAEELAPAEPSTDSAPESLGTGDDALDFSEALAGFDLPDVAGTPESPTADHASNDIGDEDFAALLASLDETLDLDEMPAASGVEMTDLSQPELPEAAAGEDHGFVAAPSAADAVPHDVTEEEAPAAGMADPGADDLDTEELQTLVSDPHPVADQADVEPVEGESHDHAQSVVEAIDEDAITPVPTSESEPVKLADSVPAIDTTTSEPLKAEAAEAVDVAPAVDHVEAVEPVAHEHADTVPEAEPAPQVVVPAESGDEIDFSHVDPDLMEVFCEEAHEILDHSDGVLAQWHAEPDESAHVASLLRDLHTLKGGARIAGLSPVGDLTHAIETVLEHPPASGSSQVLIATLEAAFDRLHGLVQRVSQGRPIAYPQAMIDHLQGWSGKAFVAADADADRDAAAPAAVSGSMPQAELPELLPDESEPAADLPSPQQEQIRVRAELLDNLVNHAGEVAIYRSRLEQQVAGYRFNLVELDQTVQRLRSQLRMLEIETEAQIIARYQREHREGGLTVFDPLELDRFSQLQQYSRALAESVSDLVSIQSMLDELTRQAETLLIQQSRVSSELQEGLLRTRMLPFDTMVPNLRRTLRQAAQEQGKSAQLHVEGAHGEMDRNLLERIKAPFEHMLRNAVAHGIESPEERQKAGKPGEGAVRIRVAREATEVVVRVSDDGRGLDREAIRKRAIERGLLREDARPGESELLGLITQPGFSTASEITQLAGRGVGMDVVANEIKQLGGSLAIDSEQGKGTTFVLRLPFTLAVTQAILVRIGEVTFAIPMTSVQGVARISPAELTERLAEADPAFEYNTERFVIHDLAELLGHTPGYVGDEEQLPLLLTRSGDLRAAIRIDEVIGSREIVVKSVGPQVSSVPGILGATIMGDGSVLIILDLAPLVRHGISRREQRVAEGLDAVEQMPVVEEGRIQPLVMVVDDSITMRKVTGRVLERHEYEVMTAKDGVDALEKLNERVPDLMLLDIEMPRMDGYELATQMKADPRLRRVPIIMITSRTGEKHRQRAFDIGVDRYLGKPYQEAELLTQIGEVLEQRAMEAEK